MLAEKLVLYDDINRKWLNGDSSLEISNNHELRIDNKSNQLVFSFTIPFSTMYWRLYKNGNRVTGIDEHRPHMMVFGRQESEEGQARVHRHDYIELSYVYRGNFAQTINGEKYEFNEGDIWIMDRNCLHGEHLLGYDGFVIFLEMREDFFNDTFMRSFDDNAASRYIRETISARQSHNRFIRFTSTRSLKSIEEIIDEILKHKRSILPGMDYIVKGLFINLFHTLALDFTFELMDSERDYHNELLLSEIERYVGEKNGVVSLNELAMRFNFHKSYFNRLIKSKLNKTFMEFIQDIRIDRAVQMIRDTNMSISEISELVGYNNRSFFYKLFKERTGSLPNEYRVSKK